MLMLLRDWYSGRAPASQAGDRGSTPLSRSQSQLAFLTPLPFPSTRSFALIILDHPPIRNQFSLQQTRRHFPVPVAFVALLPQFFFPWSTPDN